MSRESERGWRLAKFYGRDVCILDRPGRVAWLTQQLEASKAACDARWKLEDEQHKASCKECQSGDIFSCCFLWRFRSKGNDDLDRISFLKSAISSEEFDADYAEKARRDGVEHKHHIDGFCAYWQNVRFRKFEAVGWRCEGCGQQTPRLEGHHRHYNTLGFEEIGDLKAGCRNCHEGWPRPPIPIPRSVWRYA